MTEHGGTIQWSEPLLIVLSKQIQLFQDTDEFIGTYEATSCNTLFISDSEARHIGTLDVAQAASRHLTVLIETLEGAYGVRFFRFRLH